MSDSGNIPPSGPISFCNLQNVIKKQKNCSTTIPGNECKLNEIGCDMYNGRNTLFFFPERENFDNINTCTLKFSNFRQSSVLTTSIQAFGESSSRYNDANNGCVFGDVDESTVTCGGGSAANNVKRVFVNLIGSGQAPITKDITPSNCRFGFGGLNAPNTFSVVVCDPYLNIGGEAAIIKQGVSIPYGDQTVIDYGTCIQTHCL
tara:strand:+ start:838 stop:1449 length:612 start_codon:yes stop_codon:yes gene_type:complete